MTPDGSAPAGAQQAQGEEQQRPLERLAAISPRSPSRASSIP